MFSKTAWLASFKFFPHPGRRVPLFNLTSSRRVTHAQYNSPSVSPSPLFNELEEVRVQSRMGPSMYDCLTSPEKVNSVIFHV